MHLSTKGRYAVMAMADLAVNSRGDPISLADIASRQDISLSYLEQLFAKLRRGVLVNSVRGPGGGYKLARDAANIRVSDIILAVNEPMKVTRCETGSSRGCLSNSGRCLTHDLWDELGRQIHLFLNSVSLKDIVDGKVAGASHRLLSEGVPDGAAYGPATQNGAETPRAPEATDGARTSMEIA